MLLAPGPLPSSSLLDGLPVGPSALVVVLLLLAYLLIWKAL
jgi:hypothetical protein